MHARPTLSTNKIVILLLLICATLMASVMIFHERNKPKALALSADVGLLFPAAREIKPFDLVMTNDKFTQKNFLGHWTLLFFGFTHCSKVCPTTLSVMNKVYAQLQSNYPNLQVVLVSLDPERDSPETLAKYTASFHPNFIGVTGKISELRKLQSQLGIYAARDPNSGADYQLQHTASILLINPQGKWAGLFKYGLTPAQLIDGVKTATRVS